MAKNNEQSISSNIGKGISVKQNFDKFKHQETRQEVLSGRLDTVYDLNKVISEENKERVINNAGTVQKFGDFKYQDGGTVPVGEPYHIHYSRIGKSEVYMTGNKHDETSLIIDRLRGDTIFGKYVKLKEPSIGLDYLNKHRFEVTKKHRKIGHARRYFAQQGNSFKSEIFEISKVDYSKETPFYKKVQLKWSLSLSKELMTSKNINEIEGAVNKGFTSLEYALNPTEGFIGEGVLTKEGVIKKLGKLISMGQEDTPRKKIKRKKKRIRRASTTTQSTTSTTQTAPPSGGEGGGAY